MINIGNKQRYFACDECNLCSQLDFRLKLAEEYGDFQFWHCGCDKVSEEFFMAGYCEDAWVEVQNNKVVGKRKTGRAYRRKMARATRKLNKELSRKHIDNHKKIIKSKVNRKVRHLKHLEVKGSNYKKISV